MISLFAEIFLATLACYGYYVENHKIRPEIYLEKNSVNTLSKKDYTNIILILIDTLRADHLSCYGYKQNTSPNIDRFAKEGVLFTNSFSQASWTKPNVASLFTSLYPAQHNAKIYTDILPGRVNTIAEILRDKGYTTAAFVANPNVKRFFNFHQGFASYYDDFKTYKKYHETIEKSIWGKIIRNISRNRFFLLPQYKVRAEMLNSLVIPWLVNNKDNKFFLYLHYNDPHAPYTPPFHFYKEYIEGLSAVYYSRRLDINKINMALYDGEIKFTDFYIGQLLKTIDYLGLRKNSLVILLSDHGEAFREHENTEHGSTLYQEEIHVPLIMRLPSYIPANRTIAYQACTIDIMPTIFDILNINYKGVMEGKSLVPVIKGQELKGQRDYIFSEEHPSAGNVQILSLIKGEYKYIFTEVFKHDWKNEKLFNLVKDPEEFKNIINQNPSKAKIMKKEIERLTKHMKETSLSSVRAKVDEKTREEIRALGYIQ